MTRGSWRTAFRRAFGYHLAELEHDHAVADAQHQPHVVVVLPAPFGPIRPTSSPSRTSSVTSRSARAPERDRQAGYPQHGGTAGQIGALGSLGAGTAAAAMSGARISGRLCVRR